MEETEDNASVLTALSENQHLLQDKFLPTVNKWLEVFHAHTLGYTVLAMIEVYTSPLILAASVW